MGPCLTFDLRFNLEKTQNFPNQMHGVIRLGKTFNLMYVSIKSVDLHVKSVFDPCLKIIRVPPVEKNRSTVNIFRFGRSIGQNVGID